MNFDRDLVQEFNEKKEVLEDNLNVIVDGVDVKTVLALFLVLSIILNVGLALLMNEGSEEQVLLSEDAAGDKTAEFVNRRILTPSPNDVEAELEGVSSADDQGLENFYKVDLNVSNPSGSQVTEVFVKKDGSLVFLQFPRYFDEDKYNASKYH